MIKIKKIVRSLWHNDKITDEETETEAQQTLEENSTKSTESLWFDKTIQWEDGHWILHL